MTKPWSHNHIRNILWVTWFSFVGDLKDRNNDVTTFISKCLCFKKIGVTNLLRLIHIKIQFFSVFPNRIKVADFCWKNTDVSRNQGVNHVIYIFLDLLNVRLYGRFYGGRTFSPICKQPKKGPSWWRLRELSFVEIKYCKFCSFGLFRKNSFRQKLLENYQLMRFAKFNSCKSMMKSLIKTIF